MPKRRRPSSSSPSGPNSQNFLAEGVPEVHQKLLEHVLANNARLSKVRIAKLPHGIGIVAAKQIQKNEEITFIPKSLLVNLHDIPFPNSSPIDHPTKVHSSLAAYIASQFHKSPGDNSGSGNNNEPFIDILPSLQSFESSMPLFWSDQVLANCSPWVRSFAVKQKGKLEDDYRHALEMHGKRGVEFLREEYEWAWAVVNTRTIYYRPKKWYKIPAEDCMTLCPFIDYYNHEASGDESCTVSFSTDGLRVTTQKSYAAGEEIFVTYGQYNNDHLLVEYGFTLPTNPSDNINIDHWVLPKLSPRHQELWKQLPYQGECFLDESEVCYRTMMALRLAVIGVHDLGGGKRYGDFVKLVEGEMEEDEYVGLYERDEGVVRDMVGEVAEAARKDAEEGVAELEKMWESAEFWDQRESIEAAIGRWRQCLDIIAKYKEKNNN
ncbi:hypothetical protein TWF730_001367 [Orbilia blumenaviensis]|uniref:SET domain-containing protein n=1 Tax=Orbilia blumenaviensis TaxID=1796055 RepID=A0AAV9UI87_9PEZI